MGDLWWIIWIISGEGIKRYGALDEDNFADKRLLENDKNLNLVAMKEARGGSLSGKSRSFRSRTSSVPHRKHRKHHRRYRHTKSKNALVKQTDDQQSRLSLSNGIKTLQLGEIITKDNFQGKSLLGGQTFPFKESGKQQPSRDREPIPGSKNEATDNSDHRIKNTDDNDTQNRTTVLYRPQGHSKPMELSSSFPQPYSREQPVQLFIKKPDRSPNNVRVRKSKELTSFDSPIQNNATTNPFQLSILLDYYKNSFHQLTNISSSHHTPYTSSVLPPTHPSSNEACYNVRDLFLVILITSLVNLMAGIVIFTAFCCLPLRDCCLFAQTRKGLTASCQGNLVQDEMNRWGTYIYFSYTKSK